jgi:hypothetical protein
MYCTYIILRPGIRQLILLISEKFVLVSEIHPMLQGKEMH